MKCFRSNDFRTWLTAGAILALSGCGGTGDVTGKVSYNGTTLPGGAELGGAELGEPPGANP